MTHFIIAVLLAAIGLVLAGAANAVMDKLQFHFSQSIFATRNASFWNPAESWRNKWKNGDKKQGERFWGSSRWFVSLTDAWHLAQKVMNAGWSLLAAAAVVGAGGGFWTALSAWVGAQLVWSTTFSIFFGSVLERKKKKD